jgi:hypothetical protein
MKNRIIKIIVFLSFLLLFISFLNTYLSVKLWDYDFWWHLATGKYIVEHKTIPDEDPFSSVNNLEENKNLNPVREKLILKQYWLSQVIFYKIYDAFGDKGIIMFRSCILFTVLLFIFWWFKREKVSFYIIYPFVFFVFLHTLTFTGERPVLFTILFAVIIFFILDDFKQRKSKLIFSLIPLMLIWANLHGGFILGNLIILGYIAGETINFVLKRKEIEKKSLITLYIVGLVAIVVSAINPNGLIALTTLTKQNKLFQEGVQEYFSPFYLYESKVRVIDREYIILLLLFPVLAILRNKKIDIVYYIILSGLLYMSISALRFVIYYVCISSMILGRELYYALEGYFRSVRINKFKFDLVASFLILLSSVLFTSGFLDLNKITFSKAVKISVPKGAADFIRTNNIKGNMFNDMGFGGYLIWRFYPWKKVFIDTRQLNYTVTKEFEWVIYATASIQNRKLPEGKTPLWERLLDHYKIDVIIIDTMDVFGSTKPVIFSLIKSDKWVPVYCDLIGIIFLRDTKENEEVIKKYKISKDVVYDVILTRLTQWAMFNRRNPRYMLSIGDVFYNMERYKDALKAYVYADNRRPNQEYTKAKIDITRKQLEKVKGNGVKGRNYE